MAILNDSFIKPVIIINVIKTSAKVSVALVSSLAGLTKYLL